MSVKIKKTNIIMTRGDTAKIKIAVLNNDGSEYFPVEGDVIRFAAKRSYADSAPCILKEIPIDTRELVIEPADTKYLDQPISLVYDIEITTKDGVVDTFIKGTVDILEEVY